MKKHARQMFIRANARRKKTYRVHHRILLWCTCARCVRIVQAHGRLLVVKHYSTGVKMFKNINYYDSRVVSTVQTQSRTVRYYNTVVDICKKYM